MALPFVSVIIVNYNGAHFLPGCLNALGDQSYPSERFEVVVSDNGSSDHSVELIKTNYPLVHLLENNKNLGFASGNNAAIQVTSGEYVILLNNDTAPNPDWLENLVESAQKHPHAGIISGLLQLYYDQLSLSIKNDTFIPPGDQRKLGIQMYDAKSGAERGVFQYLEGFYGQELDYAGRSFRWTKSEAQLGIPLPTDSNELSLKFTLSASRPDNRPVKVTILHKRNTLAEWTVRGIEPNTFEIPLLSINDESRTALVQNAGSIIFKDGSGRDRGTFVRDNQVFFEEDIGQYSAEEGVFAGCGANLLLKREMLKDVGLLDDDFFMYYEDTDLSWRARLRGWSVLYSPLAVVRHIHCGTTNEWSPDFIYLTERNRLAMVFKNGSFHQILWTFGKYFTGTIYRIWLIVFNRSAPHNYTADITKRVKINFAVSKTLLKRFPSLVKKRFRIQSSRKVSHAEIQSWFVD